MTFRHLVLVFGCAAVLLARPAERAMPLSLSASVVWGACTSWSTWPHGVPSGPHARATPQAVCLQRE
jgi:hypothetical protein